MTRNSLFKSHFKPHILRGLALLLLLILFAQLAFSAARTSLTIDEGLHITSGYSIWRTGDYRLIEEHPPLAKLIATWPLLLIPDLPSPANSPGWGESNLVSVMQGWLQPYRPFDRIVFASRVSIMLLALLLGAIVFRWARELSGARAGLIALGIYALDPNILAHGAIAATDLATAAFIFFASYALWRALRRPTRANVTLAGVTLGLALATKISTALLIPLFILLAGIRALTANDPALLSGLRLRQWAHTMDKAQTLARLGMLVGAMLALAGLTLWGVYGFEVRTPPGWHLPIPAASHLIPLQRVQADLAGGRTTFLMGHYSQRGWWYYFPVAFAIKTPLPTLLLLLLSAVIFAFAIIRSKGLPTPNTSSKGDHVWNIIALATFPLAYSIIAIAQPFNIGYRHLLPLLPFIFVFIGEQISNFRFQISDSRLPVLRPTFYVLLFTSYIISSARIFPDYVAYFNELVGGPDGGYHYLVDSNLDWGQAWKELKAYMDAHGIARIKFAQFSSNDPAAYGIAYEPIAPMTGAPPVLPARFNPAPGVYVLSASSLQGLPLADINTYDYFRHRTPTARIGHALSVYGISPIEPPPGWVALCAAPAPPLEPADITFGFGRDDLRLVYFDCRQTWVIPGNSAEGWTVLPYAEAHDQGTFAQRWLEHAELTFEQRQSFARPPHTIFLSSGTEILSTLQNVAPLSATVGGTVQLIGYTLDRATVRPSQTVELVTLWRVIGPPPGMLSVMAHLVAADGRAVAVGDGLGFTTERWSAGDVFAQRSLLTIPPDTPPGTYWAQTGIYTLENIQRLDITQNGAVIGDSLRLAQVNVIP